MKTLWTVLLILTIVLATSLVEAQSCRNHTVLLPDGRFMICQTCCDASGNCNTTCF